MDLKIGIALSGGGARGAAHIGVLQVLHNYGVPIHALAGCSAGAVIGAMYAATLDPEWVEKRYRDYINSDKFRAIGTHHVRRGSKGEDSFFYQIGRFVKDKLVITMALSRKGIVERSKLVESIRFLIPVSNFADLKMPLRVIATDLNSGTELVYSSGDLIEAVTESSSVPGFVTPLQKNGQILADGGVSSPLPINALLDWGLDFTIGVDIARRKMEPLGDFNLMELMARTDRVTNVRLSDELARKADFLISPDVGGAHWSEFSRLEEFLKNGRDAAETSLPALKAQMAMRHKWSYRFRRWVKEKV